MVDSLFIVVSIVCEFCVFGSCFVLQYLVSFSRFAISLVGEFIACDPSIHNGIKLEG